MKYIVAIAALAACAVALPLETYPVSVSQDTLGNYKLKYTLADSARHEESIDGQVLGSYEFTDKHTGEQHKVYYVSGIQGYLPEGKDLPKPVQLTPEVHRATEEHKAIYRKVASELPVLTLEETDPQYVVHDYHVPQVVPAEYARGEVFQHGQKLSGPTDTADVAALKALHQLATDHFAQYTH